MTIVRRRRIGDRLVTGPYTPDLPPIGVPETPDGFQLGVTKATAQYVGRRASVPVEYYSGNLVITNGGTVANPLVIPPMEVSGGIQVKAANVILSDMISHMGSSIAGIDCYSASAQNVLIQRCTIRADRDGIDNVGIGGHGYKAVRCNISGAVDGFRVHNRHLGVGITSPSGVEIHGNYVHDLAYQTPWAAQRDDQTHNDCVQLQGGTGTDIFGNFFSAFGDPDLGNIENQKRGGTQVLSCVIGTPDVSSISGLRIRKNHMSGAEVKVNIADYTYGTITDVDYYGNRFERDGGYSNPDRWAASTFDANASRFADNLWADTLAPISSYRVAA